MRRRRSSPTRRSPSSARPTKIVDDLAERRDRWGFSYVIVGQNDVEAFAPVVAAPCRHMTRVAAPLLLALATLVAACTSGNDDSEPLVSVTDATADDRFPSIVDVDAAFDDDAGTWSFAVTVSSPYDTPERYADGWRVVGPDDTVYGVHTLTHDHAAEQPFTRRQTGVQIPDDVRDVTIEGRDLVNGFGGPTLTVSLEAGR